MLLAEQRQEPALLRVLRNSPLAMPLFGLPVMVMTALCTSRKQGKLQSACACGGHKIRGANPAFSYTSFDSCVQIRLFCPRRPSD